MIKIRNFRWWIVGLLMLATALNYLDKQNLSAVISELRKDIAIDNIAFGRLGFMFLFAYALMYMGGGKIIDWVGPKTGLLLMVVWWSGANMLCGMVSGLAGLYAARFLLGLGQGGSFPGCAKVASEWFPPRERSFAFGLFNTGSSIGALAAPLLAFFIISSFSWRWVFIFTGLAGFVWAVIWYFFYNNPSKSKFVTSEELSLISGSGNSNAEKTADDFDIKWSNLFSYRQLWGLLSSKFLVDSAFYFIIFWLPKYLADARGLDIKGIGYIAWIPYACMGGGSFIGGWFSSFLIKKGISIDKSRKISLGIAAAMMPVSMFITSAPLGLAIIFFSIATFAHQFYSTIIQTTCTDLFPKKVVGAVSGLAGSFGSFGAMLFSLLAGQIIQSFGYSPVFFIVGLMHPVGFLIVMIVIRNFNQVKPLTAQ